MNLFFLPFHYVITGEPQHQLKIGKKVEKVKLFSVKIDPVFRSLNFAARGSKLRVK